MDLSSQETEDEARNEEVDKIDAMNVEQNKDIELKKTWEQQQQQYLED